MLDPHAKTRAREASNKEDFNDERTYLGKPEMRVEGGGKGEGGTEKRGTEDTKGQY